MTQYKMIDILKFIFAIFVVCIHSNIAGNINSNAQWYTLTILFRMAVPFFFVASGFFFAKKYKKEGPKATWIQAKRLLVLLVFWLLIGLPHTFNTYTNSYSLGQTVLYIIRDIIFYPWGALWYISATIVGIIILSFFIKKNKINIALILSVLLFIIALLGTSYYFVLDNIGLKDIMDSYLNIFVSTRNGLFTGFPLITFGYYIALKENIIKKYNIKILISIFILFILIEAFEVTKVRYLSIEYDYFIMTIPIVTTLLMICINTKQIIIPFSTKLFRNLSTSIYVMHRPILNLCALLFAFLNVSPSNLVTTIVTFIIIGIILTPLYILDNKYINQVLK